MKFEDPALLLESGWIRPEDVLWLALKYQIRQFKISGRAKGVAWLPEVANAYVRGSYSGNLMRLLATTPPGVSEPWEDIFIDNTSLQDFLPNLPFGDVIKRRCYCQKQAHRLQEEGMMSLAKTIPRDRIDFLCAC
jgi:collagenase-like PrtC family protease